MARKALGPAAWQVTQAVAAALADEAGPVVVACSGGADSLALAAATVWVARREPIQPLAVVVDHRLQPGSTAVAARAAEQCRGLGLSAEVVAVAVTGDGSGPEAAARSARYAALEAHPGPILLGHTLDDQAEQVLLGLARGSGARSLAGMAPAAGRRRRPLLGVRRSVTAQACREWGLEPWGDPQNCDPAFARVRARERVLPVLEAELGPGIVEALARSADLLRADSDALDALVSVAPEVLDAAALGSLPAALAGRLVHRWLAGHGVGPTSAHVAAVLALVREWRGQGPIDLPGGSITRSAGVLSWTSRR